MKQQMETILSEKNAKRQLVALKKMRGIIPNTGDSVEEVRKIRKILDKEPFDIDEINALGKR